MRHVFDGGEVGRGMIGSDPTLIVAENHVHDPVQTVLDRPVAAYDRSQKMRQHNQRGDVKPCILLDHAVGFADAFDYCDGVQTRPGMAFSQPVEVMNDGDGAGLGLGRQQASMFAMRQLISLRRRRDAVLALALRAIAPFRRESPPQRRSLCGFRRTAWPR